MQLVSNRNIVFNYPKTNYSQLYLLASPPVLELFLLVAALLAACSTHASAIGTPYLSHPLLHPLGGNILLCATAVGSTT
jgi:hypothetical protein